MQVDFATFVFPSGPDGQLRLGVAEPGHDEIEFVDIDGHSTFCDRVIRTGGVVKVSYSNTDGDWQPCSFMQAGTLLAYLGAPMLSPNGRVIGAVAVQSSKERIWSSAEAWEMEVCAEFLGYALHAHFTSNGDFIMQGLRELTGKSFM